MQRFGNLRRRRNLWRRQGCAVISACVLSTLPGFAGTPSPTPRPAYRIPAAPLGFTGPSRLYMPYRIPQMSLGYLDATHLLFTFHVSRLMRRDQNDAPEDQDQTIHAVVLNLPGGAVLSQADWRLHDRGPYLWVLGDGKFLLREHSGFFVSDRTLHLTPYLAGEGTFLYGALSAGGGMFEAEYSAEVSPAKSDEDQPTTAPTLGADAPRFSARRHVYSMFVVDVADHTARKVPDLDRPIVLLLFPGGYLTTEQEKARSWAILFNPWKGEPRRITTVTSTCTPTLDSLSADAFLATGCLPFTDNHQEQAFDLAGKPLWQQLWQSRFTWGTYAYSRAGGRFAYGSFEMDHTLDSAADVDPASILGEPVGVFETGTGKLDMVLDATPIMTAGGNFALSPDGDQFAILRQGAIELYDLPPAASVPEASARR